MNIWTGAESLPGLADILIGIVTPIGFVAFLGAIVLSWLLSRSLHEPSLRVALGTITVLLLLVPVFTLVELARASNVAPQSADIGLLFFLMFLATPFAEGWILGWLIGYKFRASSKVGANT